MIARALGGGLRQHLLYPPQIRDLLAHIGKMLFGALLDFGAGLVARVDEREQLPYFFKGKTELSRT